MISSHHPSIIIFFFFFFFTPSHSNVFNHASSSPILNRALEEISGYLSSRVAKAQTVLRGTFLNYDENHLPGCIVANFKIKMFYKQRMSNIGYGGLWVADRMYSDTYHCFRQLIRGQDYLVFLNGTHFNFTQRNILSTFHYISSNPVYASEPNIRQAVTYSCALCSSPPEIELTWEKLQVKNGLRLQCSSVSDCRLPVVVFWFKNRVLIKADEKSLQKYQLSKELQLDYEKDEDQKFTIYKAYTDSILEISSISRSDHASYRCLMLTVTSLQHRELVWPPSPSTRPPSTTKKPPLPRPTHVLLPCDRKYCNGKGHCYLDYLKNYRMCRCDDGYGGETCDYSIESLLDKPMGSSLNSVYILLAVICIVLVFILITVFCVVRAFEKLKKSLVTVSTYHEPTNHSDNTYAGDNKIMPCNEYVDNQLMTSSQHPILLKQPKTPPSNRSIRKVFTHYFFGPQKSPTFYTIPTTTTPHPPKSISSPTKLSTNPQEDIELVNTPLS